MSVSSTSPRRQRKALYTADSFERRLRMGVPLSRELRSRFRRRAVPIRKGDTVRVLSGSFAGREERVAKVHRRDYRVTLDNVTLKTAEDKLKPLTLGVSNLVITRLNLSDAWRRRSLRVSEEEVTPAERGETVEGEETTEPSAAAPAVETPSEPEAAPSEVEDDATDEPEAEAETPAAPRKARAKAAKGDEE
ncbi:MAG TPA: 50S ribosomal protein L24 [Thermoplasmata archaeon]|nr:50S ribosomal protein L24 [Thermoplasmata archaeon]